MLEILSSALWASLHGSFPHRGVAVIPLILILSSPALSVVSQDSGIDPLESAWLGASKLLPYRCGAPLRHNYRAKTAIDPWKGYLVTKADVFVTAAFSLI
jgi:hypothetical protein